MKKSKNSKKRAAKKTKKLSSWEAVVERRKKEEAEVEKADNKRTPDDVFKMLHALTMLLNAEITGEIKQVGAFFSNFESHRLQYPNIITEEIEAQIQHWASCTNNEQQPDCVIKMGNISFRINFDAADGFLNSHHRDFVNYEENLK